ncbi:MAG: hypothetical protein AAF485_33355, partial [Chloroflexota bacterium]
PIPETAPINQDSGESTSIIRTVLPVFAALLGLCIILPVLGVVGFMGYSWWQKQQHHRPPPPPQDIIVDPPPKAEPAPVQNQTIHPFLAEAMRTYDDNYKAVSQALHRYLETELGTPIRGLTQANLVEALGGHNLPQKLTDRIVDYLEESEMGRFGPVTDDAGWSLMADTDDLLSQLDEVLQKRNSDEG